MSLFQRLVQLAERIRDEFNSWKQLLGVANGIATLDENGELEPSQRWAGGGGSIPDASTTVAGIIRAVADNLEMQFSTDILAVTPEALRTYNFGTSKVTGTILTGDGVQTVYPLDLSAVIDPFASLVNGSIVQVTDIATGEVLDKTEVVIRKTSAITLEVEFATAPANLAQNAVVVICVRYS